MVLTASPAGEENLGHVFDFNLNDHLRYRHEPEDIDWWMREENNHLDHATLGLGYDYDGILRQIFAEVLDVYNSNSRQSLESRRRKMRFFYLLHIADLTAYKRTCAFFKNLVFRGVLRPRGKTDRVFGTTFDKWILDLYQYFLTPKDARLSFDDREYGKITRSMFTIILQYTQSRYPALHEKAIQRSSQGSTNSNLNDFIKLSNIRWFHNLVVNEFRDAKFESAEGILKLLDLQVFFEFHTETWKTIDATVMRSIEELFGSLLNHTCQYVTQALETYMFKTRYTIEIEKSDDLWMLIITLQKKYPSFWNEVEISLVSAFGSKEWNERLQKVKLMTQRKERLIRFDKFLKDKHQRSLTDEDAFFIHMNRKSISSYQSSIDQDMSNTSQGNVENHWFQTKESEKAISEKAFNHTKRMYKLVFENVEEAYPIQFHYIDPSLGETFLEMQRRLLEHEPLWLNLMESQLIKKIGNTEFQIRLSKIQQSQNEVKTVQGWKRFVSSTIQDVLSSETVSEDENHLKCQTIRQLKLTSLLNLHEYFPTFIRSTSDHSELCEINFFSTPDFTGCTELERFVESGSIQKHFDRARLMRCVTSKGAYQRWNEVDLKIWLSNSFNYKMMIMMSEYLNVGEAYPQKHEAASRLLALGGLKLLNVWLKKEMMDNSQGPSQLWLGSLEELWMTRNLGVIVDPNTLVSGSEYARRLGLLFETFPGTHLSSGSIIGFSINQEIRGRKLKGSKPKTYQPSRLRNTGKGLKRKHHLSG